MFPAAEFPEPGGNDSPAAILYGESARVTNLDFTRVEVGGTDIAYYRYSLDGSIWSADMPVSDPITAYGLAEGEHRLEVVGGTADGLWQEEAGASAWTWRVDFSFPTADQVVLNGAPSGPTAVQLLNVSVGGGDFITYRYNLDNSGWSSETGISTPITASGLPDGAHTLQVIVRGANGNWQDIAYPAVHSWRVDLTIPTEDTVVTISAIPGVTPPATGNPPVTEITETDQYTGTVSWSPADATFAATTAYTATITLTAKSGYTLTGVAENFFTVAGTTSDKNPADSGVVTAVFPAIKVTYTADGVSFLMAYVPGSLTFPTGMMMAAQPRLPTPTGSARQR
jgi:hypothetical protein